MQLPKTTQTYSAPALAIRSSAPASADSIQVWAAPHSFPEAPGEGGFLLAQVAGRIQFPEVAGLRSLLPYWLPAKAIPSFKRLPQLKPVWLSR